MYLVVQWGMVFPDGGWKKFPCKLYSEHSNDGHLWPIFPASHLDFPTHLSIIQHSHSSTNYSETIHTVADCLYLWKSAHINDIQKPRCQSMLTDVDRWALLDNTFTTWQQDCVSPLHDTKICLALFDGWYLNTIIHLNYGNTLFTGSLKSAVGSRSMLDLTSSWTYLK